MLRFQEFAKCEPIVSSTFFSRLRASCDDRLYNEVIEQIEIELKYDGYIKRQKEEVDKFI